MEYINIEYVNIFTKYLWLEYEMLQLIIIYKSAKYKFSFYIKFDDILIAVNR